MTTAVTERTGAPAAHRGTVFDIGYQRYDGTREGRGRAWLAVFKNGVRTSLGLGRGAWAKTIPWFFIGVLAAIALVIAMLAGRFGPEAYDELVSHADYYPFFTTIIFVFAAVVAPELLCRDRRENVVHLYLVRPLTGSDYVTARWTAFFAVLSAAVWLPQLILLFGFSMGHPEPLTYLRENWLDVPRFLLAGLVFAAYITTLALLTASFTTRRAYASVFLVGLFAITTPFTFALAAELEGAAGQWVSMFNLTQIPVNVNDLIFGEVNAMTAEMEIPTDALPSWVKVAWYLGWVLVPGGVLWLRYRRLSP